MKGVPLTMPLISLFAVEGWRCESIEVPTECVCGPVDIEASVSAPDLGELRL